MDPSKLTIIVPCYNEQEALPLFYEELTRVLTDLPGEYEVLFVDDGSRDGTLQTIRQLRDTDKRVRYISFSRNFGKEAAMYAGFRNAEGDYVAVMDADLQHPPALLPQMMEILTTQEYDSVATRREDRQGEKRIRSWFSRTFYKLFNRLSDADIVEGAQEFRMMTRNMAEAVVAMGERERFSKGIFGWVGFRTCWLPVHNAPRVAGETKWSFGKLAGYAMDGIINFSRGPLRFVSWMGVVLTAIGIAALLFVVIRGIVRGDPGAGWLAATSVIVFVGGIQLLCLGIMGQYLSRIYLETKKRPHYIIADTDLEDAR